MPAPRRRFSLRPALLAGLIVVMLAVALPWLGTAWYAMRLYAMPAPSRLSMPVEGVKPKALADTWHAARAPARQHEGIDIFAKTGTPVLASTEGILLRRGENALGGNVVWVLGPAGHQHYYAHLDRFSGLAVGTRVQPGMVLGYVGKTGNARTTPAHLHYGIYTSQGPINPYPLITGTP
jgi:murein DD-endopeptidase MepM/ murein hydrolase activator NlpD